MPTSTVKYSFEFDILRWARSFSETLTGENRGFLLLLDKGAVSIVVTGDYPGGFDRQTKVTLTQNSESWFFYHPFAAPEYMWIEWKNVDEKTFERLMGKPFEQQAKHALGAEWFPVTWDVMF